MVSKAAVIVFGIVLLVAGLYLIEKRTYPSDGTTPEGNLLQNSDFEQGLASWSTENAGLTHIMSDSYSGSKAVMIGGYVDQLLDDPSQFYVTEWLTVTLKYRPASFQLYSFNGNGFIYGLMERTTDWLSPLDSHWGILIHDVDAGNGWREVQFKFQILGPFSEPHFTVGILNSNTVTVDDAVLYPYNFIYHP